VVLVGSPLSGGENTLAWSVFRSHRPVAVPPKYTTATMHAIAMLAMTTAYSAWVCARELRSRSGIMLGR